MDLFPSNSSVVASLPQSHLLSGQLLGQGCGRVIPHMTLLSLAPVCEYLVLGPGSHALIL